MAKTITNRRTATGTASAPTLQYSSNCTSGSLLVACVFQHSATNTCTVADDVNGSWTKAVGPINFNNEQAYFFFFPNNASSTKPTVTATWSGSAAYGFAIWEVTGITAGGLLDAQNSNATATPSTAPTSNGTGTLTDSDDACFGYIGACSAGAVTYDSPWTNATAVNAFNFDKVADVVASSNSSIAASGTCASQGYMAAVVAFKNGAAAAGDVIPLYQSVGLNPMMSYGLRI